MKTFFLFLACFGYVEDMGADEFAKREAAQKKLEKAGMAAYPALLQGARHKDLEIKKRSQKVLAPLYKELWFWATPYIANAMFYGGNCGDPFLSQNMEEFYYQLPDIVRIDMLMCARASTLIRKDEEVDLTNVGWVNVARHRNLGLPDPT